jgi:hypothetical protein
MRDKKFQINVRGEEKGHLFNSISQAYQWTCENVMTEEDVEYYKSIGNTIELSQIQDEKIQEAVLRNVFEKVCFSGWNDRVDLNSDYFIIH